MIHHAIYALSCFDKLDTDLDNLAFHLYNPDSYEQWGLSEGNQISPVCITLPISYPASHVSASVIDWGAAGKAYGVNLEQSVLNIVAPETPFSAFWISIGY